jgi:hypothetical protein
MSDETKSQNGGPFIVAAARHDTVGKMGEAYRADLASGGPDRSLIVSADKDDDDDHKTHADSKHEFDSKNSKDAKQDKHENKEFHPDKGAAGHNLEGHPGAASYDARAAALLDRTVII